MVNCGKVREGEGVTREKVWKRAGFMVKCGKVKSGKGREGEEVARKEVE